jgi:hypothetical protein
LVFLFLMNTTPSGYFQNEHVVEQCVQANREYAVRLT